MTIESEINRIKQNIADCYTTLTAKGATIPAVENVDNLAACILTIPATVEEDFVTQSGDTIVTSAGTPLALDGISSLTTAPSITDAQLTFADDGNSTVSFSMQQLKDYVSPAPAKQGRFVAVGMNASTGAQAASYSDDGSTWSDLSTFPTTSPICQWIKFANGKFVALRQSNNTYNLVAYSDDGITWTDATLPTYTLSSDKFISGNDKFVVMKYGTSTSYDSIYYSGDGQNWSSSRIPVVPYTIASGDGKFVVLSNNKSTSSVNLSTWSTASNLPTTLNWNALAYGGGKWVAIGSGNYPNDNTNSYIYSSDGETWTSNTLPLTMIWQSIAYGNGVFVAFGGGNSYAYSSDGVNWSTQTKPNSNCYKVWFQGGMFITFLESTNSSTYYTSTDGATWTSGTMSSPRWWEDVAYGEI